MKPLTATLCLALAIAASFDVEAQLALNENATPTWDEEILELAAILPIQEGGRVKPLDTFAQFTMLKLNGKRFMTTEDGKKLYPVEWLLNCLFYPEHARNFKHFRVDFDEVITSVGLEAHDEKRSNYSYNELAPARSKMFQLAGQYSQKEAKLREPVEQQILNLAHNMLQFESLIGALDLLRNTYHVEPDTALAAAFPDGDHVAASVALKRLPGIIESLRSQANEMEKERLDKEVAAVSDLVQAMQAQAASGAVLTIVPPTDASRSEWLSPANSLASENNFGPADPRLISAITHLEKMAALTGPGDFMASLEALHGELETAAASRGEYSKIPVEVHFYKWKYLFYSQWIYVLSFVLVAFTWLLPGNRTLHWAAFTAVLVPTVLLVIGITLRCIIRSRPPVSTLYETLLFITAVAVLVALILEVINRRGVAMAMGSFLGMVGMFLAFRYEAKEGVDTMPQLVAVLDTNFWLATHVTTVTMGYAAGLLAGALAHLYIFGRLFRYKEGDKSLYKTLARMTYGVLCFGLLFAIVGTILGGIWANDSWGRFWGWDPKENGALLICLWGLIMLHARMGGYIKDLGIANCSVVMGMIVAFSWWGVNLLGVGLHSYGFTSGIMNLLMVFWMAETVVVAVGLHVGLRDRVSRRVSQDAQEQGA
jgi:ABC-type transport system involved in cytochrome c biogenesis permease subunit